MKHASHGPEESNPANSTAAKRGITAKPWWPWAKRIITLAFFAVVTYLLISQARTIQWGEVFVTMRQRPLRELWLAGALTVASYAVYSCYDLLGRHATGHSLRTPQVVTAAFISYAFNLNMGALVGGVAFRYRLYSRFGLEPGVITRVLGMSMLTNWLGYLLLAGLFFWWSPLPLPPHWKIDTASLPLLGVILFSVPLIYVPLCAFARKRTWMMKGHDITLPSFSLALLQLLVSSMNWLLMASIVFFLLQQKIAFPTVLGVLLIAAVAGVITHIPAGLGILEAVFVALLSHQLPQNTLLAALLTYRVIYYLTPLAVATLLYLLVEARAKKMSAGQPH